MIIFAQHSKSKEIGPYDLALSKAWEDLGARDAKEVGLSSATSYEYGRYSLRTLTKTCVVDTNSGNISFGSQEPQLLAKITILHYLARCSPITPTGKAVSYRDLPGAQILYPRLGRGSLNPWLTCINRNLNF